MKNYQTPSIEVAGGSEESVVINGLVAPVYAVAIAVGGVLVVVAGGAALYGYAFNWCGPLLS